MIALCFLGFVFFALLQIWHWCSSRLFCTYAANYAAKGRALGYRTEFLYRAARVAAIPISGPPSGFQGVHELDDARNYMINGDRSGVWYRYWFPQSASEPELRLGGYHDQENIHVTVRLRNAPLLAPWLGKVMGIADNPDPSGQSSMYNYSGVFLED